MIRSAFVAAVLSVVASGSVQAAHWTATASTFQAVMAKVSGGDSVNLVGNFGVTSLTNKSFTSLVTINASAATFSDSLLFTSVSNISVVGGRFGSDSAATRYGKAIAITGGTNVSFTNPYVTGYYTGQGISFQGTTNASVTGATLTQLQAGVVFAGVNGGSISHSKSIGSVSDGIDIVDSSHIDIGHNSCTGGTPTVGAHPDCVQMFSSKGAHPLSYINIHDNYASGETQGFDNFGSVAGDSFLSIVNNRVDGLMSQGIVCDFCVNSTITGNTLTSLDGAPHLVKLEALNGTNNIIYGNSVGKFNSAAAKAIVYYSLEQLRHHTVVSAPGSVGAVPEPATWTMLVAGFAMVGFGQRSRRQALAA